MPGLARSQKAFHTLIKRSEEESINRKLNEELHLSSTSSQIDSMDFKLTSNSDLENHIILSLILIYMLNTGNNIIYTIAI